MEPQKTQNCQRNLEAKTNKQTNKPRGITLSNFRQSYEATIIKAVWHWCENSIKINGIE